jgi:hypothetical protein
VSEDTASLFLTSAINLGEWLASHLCRFTHGETAPDYPLCWALGGPQRGSERQGEHRNILLLQGIESRLLSPQARSPVAIPTGLSHSRILSSGI